MATRINQLDVMRGFALLGILIMNIISFGLPQAHYFNPHAEGPLHGWNRGALVFSELFANEKFMGLFSLLFGASVVLFTDKVEEKGRSALAFHMRRNGWLLVFGLLHAYLLWIGDILVTYALCSVWLFFVRKWSARKPHHRFGFEFAFAALGGCVDGAVCALLDRRGPD